MISAVDVAALLRHVERLNTFDPNRYRMVVADGQQIGWMRPDVANAMMIFPELFVVDDHGLIMMGPDLKTEADRSAAMADLGPRLIEHNFIDRLRGETYAITNRFGAPPVLHADRALVPLFGFRGYGVHVNGYLRRPDGVYLWLGRRSKDKEVAPGQWDNMIAGGQPAGLSLMDNLIKEAEEEASVPEALARTARPVGCINYMAEGDQGVKPDCMFLYDLEVPEDFVPTPNDDEMESFELVPVAEALALVANTDDVKFNVNLALIDFALRHGALDPDASPAYEALVTGLRGRAFF